MSELSLTAIKREGSKGSDLTELRTNGMIPGIFYGSGESNILVAAKDLDLRKFVYDSGSHLINLTIEGVDKKFTCILKDVQFDPLKYKPIHFDLLAIKADEKIKVEVPVHAVGTPIGVKEGGVLQLAIHRLEVECLPKDIPASIDINVEGLKIGDSIKVEDIQANNFVIMNEPTANVISVSAPVAEVTEEAAASESETQEPEVISKGKQDEGASNES